MRHHDIINVLEPLSLSAGKKTGHVDSAYDAFIPLLAAVHPGGISIEVSVFDRALQGSMHRLLVGRAAQYFHERAPVTAADPCGLGHLLCWQTSIGCCIHDTHNAFRWCCLPDQFRESVLDDCHHVIEAL